MAMTDDFAGLYGPYFTYEEMSCRCNECRATADPGRWFRTPEFQSFMVHLIRLRKTLNFPFIINSGYRCPAYNAEISSTGPDGPHTRGAADVRVAFERAYDLAQIAFDEGLGVGLAQKGEVASRFIHVDNLGRRLWTY